ncbi:glucosidase 2 subunit beta [Aristolochia californica]|uniref:glucosidase 2 subunit beta n=1 Tax=Aristolochia californica TaxID=171875 RepID=UPI0035DD9F57
MYCKGARDLTGKVVSMWKRFRVLFVESEERQKEVNTQSAVLKMELEELKSIKVALEEKVNKFTTLCNKLGIEVARLEEDLVVANERIAVLECCRRRDEEEIDSYKKRFIVLEEQILEWNEKRCMGVNTDVESNKLFDEVSYQEKAKNVLLPVEEKNQDVATKGLDILSSTPRQMERKKLNSENLVVEIEYTGKSPINGNSPLRGIGQTSPGNSLFDSFHNYKAKNIDDLLATRKDTLSRARKSLSFIEKGTLVDSETAGAKSLLREDLILISDDDHDDDEKKNAQVLNDGIVQDSGSKDTEETLKGGRYISQPTVSSNMPFIQEIERATQDNASGCKDFLSPSTPKKKRKLKVVTSDTEDDVDMDRIPIKRTWLNEVDKDIVEHEEAVNSAVDQSNEPIIPSDGDDIEEPVSPQTRRLFSLRKCKKVNCRANETSAGFPIGNQMSLTEKETLRTGGIHLMHEGDIQEIAKEDAMEENESDGKTESVTVTSGSVDVKGPMNSMKKRFLPVRKCRMKNCWTQGTSGNGSLEQNECTGRANGGFGTSQTSCKLPKRMVSTISLEDDMEEEDSESESESLSGFIVDKSSSSGSEHSSNDSRDESDTDSGLSQLFNRHKDSSNCVDEGQLLSSLGKNLELCMKAVCALYRRQTSEEQSVKGTIYHNKRGFNTIDALRGSQLAEFLTAGDPCGRVTKTIQDLKTYDPSGPELCRNLAFRYSKQLFQIYKTGEDPNFQP